MTEARSFASGRRYRPRMIASMLASPIMVLLVGCAALGPERRLETMMRTIPEPPKVSLVQEIKGISGGSDERCYGAYAERLYGTESAFDTVLRFYEGSLSRDEWHRDRASSGSAWMSSTRHFALSVCPDVHASVIPSESIEMAQKEFATLYILVLTYMADPSCWQF